MTTIAWDGHILAADSQTTSGDSVALYANKIHQSNDGYIVGTGTLRHILELKDWIDGVDEEKPEGLDATCFHISKNFLHRYEDGVKAIPLDLHSPISTGTGWEWAMAAMDFGCNAIEAVEYAIKKDIYTGGEVYFVEIIPRRKRKK